jgi:hypothetical protein
MLESHGLPLKQATVWGGRFRSAYAEPGRLRPHHLEQRQIAFIQVDGRAGQPLQPECAANVVDMGMGDEDLLNRQALIRKPLVDAADVISGINDDGLAGLLVAQDGAVALQGSDGKRLKNHTPDHCRG